ncbi:MAG TPA: ABC transporter ATP-binding protein [Candidatus Brocadiia bacterium]|mgnify:CR=1 FL=1|nr:ABC transporter ATP-binding protein [Candidatus Brocadiia bacterium]
MIEIDCLTKTFGDKTAVSDLTLRVEPGECFAFLGPNGAGKTTTIKTIAGLLRPTRGAVRVGGADTILEPLRAKARLAYVPDEPYLYEKLSGREFLLFTADMYGLDRPEARRRIAELVETFGLAGYVDDLCEGYSHGMKQRVVLSAALLRDPATLVVDEPMVGLDPRGARLVKDILRRRAEAGVCVFLSTHTLSVAEEVATRIGIIHQSRLIALGTPQELRSRYGGERGLESIFLELTRESEKTAPPPEEQP